MNNKKTAIFIPTYNAGKEFEDVLRNIENQACIDYKFIIDSGSNDDTVKLAKDNGWDVTNISPSEFGHGKTRTKAAKFAKAKGFDYVVFMTQDVYLQENAVKEILRFINENINLGVVYGKQKVDIEKSNIFEKRSREFNYPEESVIKFKSDRTKLGIKTVFSSDAFCIYDLKKMEEVNYFSDEIQFSEDMYIAYKFIENGYGVGYCAEAEVYHSHNLSLKKEFERYKNIGKFHKLFPDIQIDYGSNNKEGIKFLLKDIKYLVSSKYFYLIPKLFLLTIVKFLGYKIGNW